MRSGPTADPRWIVAELSRVLDVAEAAIASSSTNDNERRKVVAETALLVRAVARAQGLPRELVDRARHLGGLLVAEARDPSVIRLGALRPSAVAELAAAHVALSDAGFADPEFDTLLCHLLSDPEVGRVERLPWKELEQTWLRRRIERHDDPMPAAAIALTALARGCDVLAADREEMYSLTHAVMYLTGFGDEAAPLPRPGPAIVADVDAALVRTLVDEDYDLAGELLLAFPYLRIPWSPMACLAFERLCAATEAAGVLPSLGFRADVYAGMSREDGDAYAIAESYHTEFVWGFLLIALLLPGVAWPDASDPNTHTAFQRDASAWQAVREQDVVALATALSDRAIAPTSFSRQADRLLVRLALWAAVSRLVPANSDAS